MVKSFLNRPSTGFTLTIVFTIITSGLSYLSVRKFSDSEKWVNHTDQVRSKLEKVISFMKDAETGQRGYLLTGNELFLAPYLQAEHLVRSTMDTIQTLTLDNPSQQGEFKGLKTAVNAEFDLLRATIAQKGSGGQTSLDVLLMAKSYLDRTRLIINRMENREEVLLATRISTLHLYGTLTCLTIFFAFLVSLVITVYYYNRTVKSFAKRLALADELREEAHYLVSNVSKLKDFASRIEKGEYGLEINLDHDGLRR